MGYDQADIPKEVSGHRVDYQGCLTLAFKVKFILKVKIFLYLVSSLE